MSKTIVLMLFGLLALSSLVMVESVFAQSIPKPSVPEFTVKLVDHSYVVPETTSIDPYTGEEIIHPSYQVENKTIDIIINNQPFVSSDNLTKLYYGVRVKGHFEDVWNELYYISNDDNRLYLQSASENTVISIPQDYSPNSKVDFQVEAVIATLHPFFNTNFGYWTWVSSDWSNTRTLIIKAILTPSPSPEPTPTSSPYEEPQQTEQELILGVAFTVAIIVAGLGLLLYRIKSK